MKKETQVIVEIRGGCVWTVKANEEITVIVRDWDNIEQGDDDPAIGINQTGFVSVW